MMQGGGADTMAGNITLQAGPTVAYGTSSDRRLKTEVGPIGDAADRLAVLRPLQFTWNEDPDAGVFDGFFADEVAPVVAGAVVGEPDAVDPDTGGIVAQQLDPAKLVPLLVATVQQLLDRVATLEAAAG